MFYLNVLSHITLPHLLFEKFNIWWLFIWSIFHLQTKGPPIDDLTWPSDLEKNIMPRINILMNEALNKTKHIYTKKILKANN